MHHIFQTYVPSDIVCVIVSLLPLTAVLFVVLEVQPDTLWYMIQASMFVSVGVYWNEIEPLLFQLLLDGASKLIEGSVESTFNV